MPGGAGRPSSTGSGFDPAVDGSEDGETAVIAFAHCPFRELAEAHPELVCSLHRGMVEGFVEAMGDAEVDDFHPLAHRAALPGEHLVPITLHQDTHSEEEHP